MKTKEVTNNNSKSEERRSLNAVVFADVVGFTAMIQVDEAKAIQVIEKFKSQVSEVTQKFQGKLIELEGDGCLLTFESSVNALNATLTMQKAFQQGLIVPVRVGIHSGDILYKDESVYGTGVNIASRIESMGLPGSILVSKDLMMQVKSHPNFKMHSVGVFEFKNVTRPIEVFAIEDDVLKIPERGQLLGKFKTPVNLFEKGAFLQEISYRRMPLLLFLYAIVSTFLIYLSTRSSLFEDFPNWYPLALKVFLGLFLFPFLFVIWKYRFHRIYSNSGVVDGRMVRPSFWTDLGFKDYSRMLVLPIIAISVIALNLGKVGTDFFSKRLEAQLFDSKIRDNRVAILPFENKTDDASLDELGTYIQEYIAKGLQETKAQVVNYGVARERMVLAGFSGTELDRSANDKFYNGTKAEHVIVGKYYKIGSDIEMHAHLINTISGENLHQFKPVLGPIASPSKAVVELRNRIAGFWTLKNDIILKKFDPPSIEAVKEYKKGNLKIRQRDTRGATDHFVDAAAIDSGYTMAWINVMEGSHMMIDSDEPDSIRQKYHKLRDQAMAYIMSNESKILEYEYNYFKAEVARMIDGDYEEAIQYGYSLLEVDTMNYKAQSLVGRMELRLRNYDIAYNLVGKSQRDTFLREVVKAHNARFLSLIEFRNDRIDQSVETIQSYPLKMNETQRKYILGMSAAAKNDTEALKNLYLAEKINGDIMHIYNYALINNKTSIVEYLQSDFWKGRVVETLKDKVLKAFLTSDYTALQLNDIEIQELYRNPIHLFAYACTLPLQKGEELFQNALKQKQFLPITVKKLKYYLAALQARNGKTEDAFINLRMSEFLEYQINAYTVITPEILSLLKEQGDKYDIIIKGLG